VDLDAKLIAWRGRQLSRNRLILMVGVTGLNLRHLRPERPVDPGEDNSWAVP